MLPNDRLRGVEYIVVDETPYKRGHKYITVIMAFATGRVTWMGERKAAAILSNFFSAMGPKGCKKLKLLAIDMSLAQITSVTEYAPQEDIFYDQFHVVKLLLDAVNRVRREEVRNLKGKAKAALKFTRFSLLLNPRRHLSQRDTEAIKRNQATNRSPTRVHQHRCDFESVSGLDDEQEAK